MSRPPVAPAAPGLDDGALLAAWERGLALERPWRELVVLEAAGCGPAEELAGLPIGRRDRLALAVHERTFGRRIEAEATCPSCSERLELEVDAAIFGSAAEAEGRDGREAIVPTTAGAGHASDAVTWVTGEAMPPTDRRTIELDGWRIVYRAPDSRSLLAGGGENGADRLLAAMLVEATHDGSAVEPAIAAASMPLALRDQIEEGVAELDPGSELLVETSCPACGVSLRLPYDPAGFLLAALESRALRVLQDVDILARAYGWREAEVLALSPLRRDHYLHLALS